MTCNKRFHSTLPTSDNSSSPPTPPHPALVDLFSRHHTYLRVSLTERCNLRCTYCMPPDGVKLTPQDDVLTTHEIIRIITLLARMGVNKIRFTGGEPTVRKDIVHLVQQTATIGTIQSIGITTNGLLLIRYLESLAMAGLTHLNVSLDSLDAKRFETITRRNGHAKVLEGLRLAMSLLNQRQENGHHHLQRVKINCVVQRGVNDDELTSFVALTRDHAIDVRFLEFMPFSENGWDETKLVPYQECVHEIRRVWPDFVERPMETEKNPTAKMYAVPGFKGRIGFMSSMTDDFCATCNRLRVTADGNLKVCLFGKQEVSLRDCIRRGGTDEDLESLIASAVRRKAKRLGGFDTPRDIVEAASQNLTSASSLTHVNPITGRARIVDISDKPVTERVAVARATMVLDNASSLALKDHQDNKKGSPFHVATIAGIMAAKRTSDTIPLCHQIPLTRVDVDFIMKNPLCVLIECRVQATWKTGVEMEALVGASAAALTLYDMLKASSRAMMIERIELVEKRGGKSNDYVVANML